MKKILLAPDSLKGSLSSVEACAAMKRGALRADPTLKVQSLPVADGGEGTVEAFLSACGGERIRTTVQGPYFEETPAVFAMLPDGTAVLECASCCGLIQVAGRENPMLTTSYGLGQLMCAAVENGARRLLVGLGGSCTNDGGAGAAAAVGVRFFDQAGQEMLPVGGTLADVARIVYPDHPLLPEGVTVTAICDVQNPLVGPQGATRVYAPQKGATLEMVELLEAGMLHFADVLEEACGVALHTAPGAGAAGGLGAGLAAFFGADRQSGIEAVLSAAHFDSLLDGCDLVLTGEGHFDSQSLCGKVASGIAAHTARRGVPLVVLAGAVGPMTDLRDTGITAVVPILREAGPLSFQMEHAAENLAEATETVVRLVAVGTK